MSGYGGNYVIMVPNGVTAYRLADGFTDVAYIDPEIKIVDDTSAILSAKWQMNKAFGVITNELWVLQDDGNALLREDDFEVLG